MSKETNAERLERLSRQRENYGSDVHRHAAIKVDDFQWLIEQAEENARLRRALAFYADGANWSVEIIKDNGNKHQIAHVVTGDSWQKALKTLEVE